MLNKDSIYAFLTALFFATLGILAKYIYACGNITTATTFFYSVFFSVVILFFYLVFKYKNLSFLGEINKKSLIYIMINTAFIGLFIPNFLALKALEYIEVGIQKAIIYSNPLFIILINCIFLGKKLQKNDIVGVMFMLIGLYFIIGEINKSVNIILGIIFTLVAALFIAIYSIVEENSSKEKIKPLIYWFYSFLFTTILAFFYLIIIGEISGLNCIFHNKMLLFLLLATALFSFVLPYICFLKSIETIGAAKTGIISSISPVMAIILSGIFFGERLTYLQILGVILIIISSLLSAKK